MTPVAFALFWAFWFGSFFFLKGLVKIIRRQRAQRIANRRSDKHEAWLAFALEIVSQPEIQQAAINHGSITVEGLIALRQALDEANLRGARVLVAKLLESRIVRRIVVNHMSKVHGVKKSTFMRNLSAFMGEVRG